MFVHKEDSDIGDNIAFKQYSSCRNATVTTVNVLSMSLSNNYIHLKNQHKTEVIVEDGPKGKRNYDQTDKERGWGKKEVKKGRRQRYDTCKGKMGRSGG
jgi:hypothetical protein